MDDGKVVHFVTPLETGRMDSSEIIESDFHSFLGSDHPHWFIYKYGLSEEEFSGLPRGTCTTRQSEDTTSVLQRAYEALREGFGQFNLVGCNCEDFAVYCKTGQRSQTSGQYLSAMRRIQAVRQAAATGYKNPIVYAGCVLGWFTASDFGNQTDSTNDKKEESNAGKEKGVSTNTEV